MELQFRANAAIAKNTPQLDRILEKGRSCCAKPAARHVSIYLFLLSSSYYLPTLSSFASKLIFRCFGRS